MGDGIVLQDVKIGLNYGTLYGDDWRTGVFNAITSDFGAPTTVDDKKEAKQVLNFLIAADKFGEKDGVVTKREIKNFTRQEGYKLNDLKKSCFDENGVVIPKKQKLYDSYKEYSRMLEKIFNLVK